MPYVYLHVAVVPATLSRVVGSKRQPPPKRAKRGPRSGVMPTEVGGRYEA